MKLMFGFRQQNRKRRALGQRVKSLGERLAGMGRKALPLIFLLAVAVGVPFGIFQAYIRTVSGAYFELSEIKVIGLEHIERAALLEKAGLIAGRNIFDIDPERADAAIESHPWVQQASVERRLPDRITVTLTEFVPVAILVGERYWLVDEDGVVFESIEPGASLDEFLTLPMISGLEVYRNGEPGGAATVNKTLFLEAMDVARLYAKMGLSNWEPLSEIHIDPTLGLTLVSADTGVEIRLGRGRYRERLQRLKVVQRSIVKRAMEVDYILIDQESDLSRVAVGLRHGPRMGPDGRSWAD
jgi:cell division protein FtsQ